MLETFRLETFLPLVNDEFLIRVPGGETITVHLAEANGISAPRPPDRRTPFAITFRGPPAPILAQRIYPFEHATLGAFELFIVPLTPDAGGTVYEAVFA